MSRRLSLWNIIDCVRHKGRERGKRAIHQRGCYVGAGKKEEEEEGWPVGGCIIIKEWRTKSATATVAVAV